MRASSDWIAERDGSRQRRPTTARSPRGAQQSQADVAEKKQTALEAGGLYVLGTERHESRRIDNQLRGRSGRQGDPGRSKFYLALEDDLMRIFGSERMDSVLQTLGLQEGEAITHPWMNKSLEMAQKKVEARNFDIRKQILKYDDVMNDQRKVIFEQRIDIMGEDDVSETVKDLRHQVVDELVRTHIPETAYAEQWNTAGAARRRSTASSASTCRSTMGRRGRHRRPGDQERLLKAVDEKARSKEAELGRRTYRQIEKMVLLQTLDHLWREHLVTLEHLRQVIGFRAYGQRDPLNEYKSEAFVLFEAMLGQPARGRHRPADARRAGAARGAAGAAAGRAAADAGASRRSDHRRRRAGAWPMRRWPPKAARRPARRPSGARRCRRARPTAVDPNDPATWGQVSRNALCPCGSGKKYKHCHGKND